MSFLPKPRTVEEGLLNLTDCTLATVEGYLDLSRPPKGETSRQIEMAQTAIDVIMASKLDTSGSSRVHGIIQKSNGRVAEHYGWKMS